MNILTQMSKPTSDRTTAIVIGSSLPLMAVLAGIAFPALGTLKASFGFTGIFILDIMVSVGIYIYYQKQNFQLSIITSLLRIVYSVILGVGIVYHFLGNVNMFNQIFSFGLIIFGIHMIGLGILFNNEGGKKWISILIKSLIIIAGIGYIIIHLGKLFVAHPLEFTATVEPVFIVPMILGEVVFAIWMLVKGGRK